MRCKLQQVNPIKQPDFHSKLLTFLQIIKSISFHTEGKRWKYDSQTTDLKTDTSTAQPIIESANVGCASRSEAGIEVLSPDKNKAAYVREYNLWIRDIQTGQRTRLTTDGIKDFGYATDNAGWR